MKKLLIIVLILAASMAAFFLTKKDKKDYSDFLGSKSSSIENEESIEEPNEAPQNAIEKKDRITITAGEWDLLTQDRIKCQAELKALAEEITTARKASYSEGQLSCLNGAQQRQAEASEKFMQEAQAVINELKNKLVQYRLPYAVVNGECDVLEKSGKRASYDLTDVCVKVVSKKVDNDGELSGIIDAISTEAAQYGIVSISCDVGRARLDFIAKKCDDIEGSAGAAMKFEKR